MAEWKTDRFDKIGYAQLTEREREREGKQLEGQRREEEAVFTGTVVQKRVAERESKPSSLASKGKKKAGTAYEQMLAVPPLPQEARKRVVGGAV